mgnify:FL=1
MKKIVVYFILLFITIGTVVGQEFLSPLPTNKDERLTHGIAVYAVNDSFKEQFTQRLKEEMGKRSTDIQILKGIEEYPDILFLLDWNEELVRQAVKEFVIPVFIHRTKVESAVSQNCHIIRATDLNASGKAADFIKKIFYQGKRPVYSTIFEDRKEGYFQYRIPSVLALPDGKIIAFAEARAEGKTDCAENDIVAKISRDNGKTWGPMILVAESGEASLNNPTAVYVEEKSRIILMYQQYPPKQSEGSTQTGFEGDNICRVFISFSDDGGNTWSPKKDITLQAKLPSVTGFASGPGCGIRVVSGPDKGRILMPFNVSGGSNGWFNYLVYSDDLGETWNILPGHSSYGTNESQVVQLSDTCFMVNARCHRFPGEEAKAPYGWNPWNFSEVTRCRGEIPVSIRHTHTTWGDTRIRKDMPDPLCQGAIYRYSGLRRGEKSRILFVNPASGLTVPVDGRSYQRTPPMRMNGTVRVSYDDAGTWSHSKRIYGNRYTGFQYSVLTRLKEGMVGCIFEASPQIRFVVFNMEWLTSGEDKGEE